MKNFAVFIAVALLHLAVLPYAAAVTKQTVVFRGRSGNLTAEVPEDLVPLLEDNRVSIERALQDNNVSQSELNNISSTICNQYDAIHIDFLYSKLLNGILDVSGLVDRVIPNSQAQQSVWAQSLISSNRPEKYKVAGGGLNMGMTVFGFNVLEGLTGPLGMKKLSLGPVFLPTLTLDARVCGFVVPMDFGLAFSMFDTSAIGPVSRALDPVSFNFLTIGGDVRYAFFNGKRSHVTASGGAGIYYTKSGLGINGDSAQVSIGFSTLTAFLSAQASYKFHVLVPFLGVRFMLSRSDVNWNVHANWNKILDAENSSLIRDAVRYHILPSTMAGSGTSHIWENPKLDIYGGLGFEFGAFYLTTGLCYDPFSTVFSGSLSTRLVF